MKKLIYIAAFVVVVGGFLVGAVQVHETKKQQQQAQTQSLQQKLTTAEGVVSNLQNQFNSYKQTATSQFTADQKALCNFITSHVNTKTVPVPSECTSSPL